MNPRFDKIVEKYTNHVDGRSVPRDGPAKVYATLGECGHMHFDNSDATVAAISQMMSGALCRTCAASVIRYEVGSVITNFKPRAEVPLRHARNCLPRRVATRRVRQFQSERSPSNPAEGGLRAGTHHRGSRRGRGGQDRHQQGESGGKGIADRRGRHRRRPSAPIQSLARGGLHFEGSPSRGAPEISDEASIGPGA